MGIQIQGSFWNATSSEEALAPLHGEVHPCPSHPVCFLHDISHQLYLLGAFICLCDCCHPRAGFLSLGTTDSWAWILLVDAWPAHDGRLSSSPSLDPLDARRSRADMAHASQTCDNPNQKHL